MPTSTASKHTFSRHESRNFGKSLPSHGIEKKTLDGSTKDSRQPQTSNQRQQCKIPQTSYLAILMMFTLRSFLAPLALVVLSSIPTAVVSQLPDIDGLVPDACLLQFDEALECVLDNLLTCVGIIDLADSLPMLAEEADSCASVQAVTCAVYDACEPCETQFAGFLDCTLSTALSGELSLRQGTMTNMTDCEDMAMNMTMVDDMIMEECMNMTEGGGVELEIDFAECDLGPEACA